MVELMDVIIIGVISLCFGFLLGMFCTVEMMDKNIMTELARFRAFNDAREEALKSMEVKDDSKHG